MKTSLRQRLVGLGRVSKVTRAITPFVTEEFGNPEYGWPL